MGVKINLYQATRHSLATNLLKDSGDLKSVGDILGHTNIDNQKAVFKKQGEDIGLNQSVYSPTHKDNKNINEII